MAVLSFHHRRDAALPEHAAAELPRREQRPEHVARVAADDVDRVLFAPLVGRKLRVQLAFGVGVGVYRPIVSSLRACHHGIAVRSQVK